MSERASITRVLSRNRTKSTDTGSPTYECHIPVSENKMGKLRNSIASSVDPPTKFTFFCLRKEDEYDNGPINARSRQM